MNSLIPYAIKQTAARHHLLLQDATGLEADYKLLIVHAGMAKLRQSKDKPTFRIDGHISS